MVLRRHGASGKRQAQWHRQSLAPSPSVAGAQLPRTVSHQERRICGACFWLSVRGTLTVENILGPVDHPLMRKALLPLLILCAFASGADTTTSEWNLQGSKSSDQPFFGSIPEPEGNYKVTVTLGDPNAQSTTT